jgi:hypothetical protein
MSATAGATNRSCRVVIIDRSPSARLVVTAVAHAGVNPLFTRRERVPVESPRSRLFPVVSTA